MEDLKGIYFYVLPIVLVAAIAEGIVLAVRTGKFDWKSWACSLADLAGRQFLSLFPLMLAAPKDTKILIRAVGLDAEEAVAAIGELIARKFGEE